MADCIIPEGYKETVLGVIPKDWEVKVLGDLCDSIKSGNNKEKVNKGKYPVYGSTGIIGYTDISVYDGLMILIARVGANAGFTYCVDGKYDVSDNTLILNVKSCYNFNFAYNQLLFYNLNKLVFGSGQPLVTAGQLKSLKILLPSLSEQQKIAEIFNVWDKAIEKQTQLIEKLELRKKGLMQQLLTGKKRLPGFSGEWKKSKLGDATIFLSTNSFSREQLNSVKGNILNIHYGDVLVRYSSVLDVSKENIPYINQQIEYSPKDYISNGDVIMADTAEDEMVGRCCEVINIDNIKVVSGLHTILIRPIIKFAPKYLGYYLNSERYHKQIISIMQGIKVYSITKDALKNTTIDIPCIEEQAAIANILSLCDHEVLLAKQKLSKFQWQKKGLMQVLLTGKKRVTQ